MSDDTAPVGGVDSIESIPVITPAEGDKTPISAREAAQQLASHRWKRDNPEEAAKAAPKAAPVEAAAEPDSAQADNSDPETAPAEATETVKTEPEVPAIDPPRSWTKEEKEEFATYPREAQEKIARREQDRESALRRSQNENAEKLKGLTAKEQAAEQARQQYEQALPQLLQTLQDAQQGEFSDIKTMADVTKMANEDWPRYAKWDAQQKQIAAVAQEAKASQERQSADFKKQWSDYAEKQDKLASDLIPDLADPDKSKKLGESVLRTVESVGFTKEEFAKAWTGEASISPRDARWQQILEKAARYDQAKSGVAKPAAKPIPNVQRPGTSKTAISVADAEIQTLEKAFDRNPNVKNAAALRIARQRAA